MTPELIISGAGLAIVILGALWKFSHTLGTQTQILITVSDDLKNLRREVKEDLEVVHRRVDKLGAKTDHTHDRQMWLMGKMGIEVKEGVNQ